MKKLILTLALAFSLALPMAAISTDAMAVWYKAHNPGYWVDIYSEPGYRKGRLRCRIAHGQYVKTQSNVITQGTVVVDGKTYYHVYWHKPFGTMEWHWRDGMNNAWCPHWNRHGYAEKDLLRKVRQPEGWWIN